MSDIDLTEAIEAAAQAHLAATAVGTAGVGWADLNPWQQHSIREYVLPMVSAAAPLIEAQVREQVAREIEQLAGTRRRHSGGTGQAYDSGNSALLDAARIARGGAR